MLLAIPIEVAAVCQKKDKPVPKKFKYTPAVNEPTETITVNKVLSVEEIKDFGSKAYLYKCQSYIDDMLKTYELKFIIDRHEWQLYKM